MADLNNPPAAQDQAPADAFDFNFPFIRYMAGVYLMVNTAEAVSEILKTEPLASSSLFTTRNLKLIRGLAASDFEEEQNITFSTESAKAEYGDAVFSLLKEAQLAASVSNTVSLNYCLEINNNARKELEELNETLDLVDDATLVSDVISAIDLRNKLTEVIQEALTEIANGNQVTNMTLSGVSVSNQSAAPAPVEGSKPEPAPTVVEPPQQPEAPATPTQPEDSSFDNMLSDLDAEIPNANDQVSVALSALPKEGYTEADYINSDTQGIMEYPYIPRLVKSPGRQKGNYSYWCISKTNDPTSILQINNNPEFWKTNFKAKPGIHARAQGKELQGLIARSGLPLNPQYITESAQCVSNDRWMEVVHLYALTD